MGTEDLATTGGGWGPRAFLRVPRRNPPSRRGTVRGALVASLATSLLLVVGCGADDDAGTDGVSGGQSGRAGGESAATDAASVERYVEELLAEHDDVVNQIIADPSVAADPDSELVQRYLDLYEPDSEFAREAVQAWTDMSEAERSIRPYNDEHPATETRLDGEIEVESEDEVIAPICELRRQRVYENGLLKEGVPLLEQAASVTVVRVEGEWLLERREAATDIVGCRGEGS